METPDIPLATMARAIRRMNARNAIRFPRYRVNYIEFFQCHRNGKAFWSHRWYCTNDSGPPYAVKIGCNYYDVAAWPELASRLAIAMMIANEQ